MKKSVNGVIVDMTADEIAVRQSKEAKALEEKQNEEQAMTDAETKKASGKQKLKDLGLDDAEIKALIGA